MRWALPFILLSLGASLSAQEKIVSGSATVELLPGWSIERAQRQAYQLAILNALQTNFPSHIAQASKYILQNRTTGSTASTQTYFYLTSDQYIGAEWLQTTSIRYETSHEKGTWYITCKVKGRARPRTEPPLPLDIRPLRCQDTACFTLDFKDGDPLYLYFRTPVAGTCKYSGKIAATFIDFCLIRTPVCRLFLFGQTRRISSSPPLRKIAQKPSGRMN